MTGLRLVRERAPQYVGRAGSAVVAPAEAARILAPAVRGLTVENAWALHLDGRNRCIGVHHLSVGTARATLIPPTELLRVALYSGAVAILLAHNHPSGDPTPSHEDAAITERVRSACEAVDLTLHDHVVLSDAWEVRETDERGAGIVDGVRWVSMSARGWR